MGAHEDVVECRGYLILRRVYPGTATDRIVRPDGTWRDSPPSFVCDEWTAWVVARRSAAGDIEELEAAATDDEARRWVDAHSGGGPA